MVQSTGTGNENSDKYFSFIKTPVLELYVLKTGNTRVLRPCEYRALYNAVPKKNYKTILNALLLTGMRYVEMKRFQKNPEWFDGDFIHLPKEAERKIASKPKKRLNINKMIPGLTKQQVEAVSLLMSSKGKQRKPRGHTGRDIRLNSLGKTVVSYFIDVETPLPCWQTWKDNLRRWAVKGGLDPAYINVKTTRKTFESWLFSVYGSGKLTEITMSQGHTSGTSVLHYLKVGFRKEDVTDMSEYVSGWIQENV